MRKVFTYVTILLATLLLSSRAQAQFGPPNMDDPDTQEMMQMGMQVFQRMQEAGIDMQSIGEQMQSGTIDAEQFQQMLMDKGIIDDDMMGRMQKTGTRVAIKMLRQQLEASDEEWAVLGPKIERVFNAFTVMNNAGAAGGAARMRMMPTNNASPVTKAMKALKEELAAQATNEGKLLTKLIAYRDAVARASAELKAARESLQGVLTLRQELLLLEMGLLE